MKSVLFVILSCMISGLFLLPYSFSETLEIAESDISWDKGNYRLTNGTAIAKIILIDHKQNQNPSHVETVTVFVYSDSFPDGIQLVLYEVEKNSGIFARDFSLSDSRSAPSILHVQNGDTAVVTYTNESLSGDNLQQKVDLTATVLIGSTGPPMERAPAKNARISDINGNAIHIVGINQQIVLMSDISNTQNINQTFVWFAQITDSNKKIESLNWINGTLGPNFGFSPSTSWIPVNPGNYHVTFFVWESITNPSALSVPITLDFVVSQESLMSSDSSSISQCDGTKMCLKEKVLSIVDGDTIHISGGHEVRLSLTNTPEIYEKGFHDATKFTSELCPVDSTVIVDQDDEQPYDVYGRLLGKVYCQNIMLNSELLDEGHANILTQYCTTSEFSDEPWAQKYGC